MKKGWTIDLVFFCELKKYGPSDTRGCDDYEAGQGTNIAKQPEAGVGHAYVL